MITLLLIISLFIINFDYKTQSRMKFSEIKEYQGECCPVDLIKGEVNEKLQCIICYQVMTKPVTVACPSGHTFGMACLKDWVKDKEKIVCPYCRGPANGWTTLEEMTNSLKELEGTCSSCNKWQGKLQKLHSHKDSCLSFRQELEKKLQKTVKQQIKQLDTEINPHLKQLHSQIYETYVQNWAWLKWDLRNWKWWWWCNNPWWQNKSCPQCNTLWHKYQRKIDLLEAQRINLIQTINAKFGKKEKEQPVMIEQK